MLVPSKACAFMTANFIMAVNSSLLVIITAFVGWQVHDVLMKEFRNDASESTSDKLIWNQTVSRLQVLVTFIFSGLTLLARAIVCFVQAFRPVPAACWITGAGGTFVSGLVDMLLGLLARL